MKICEVDGNAYREHEQFMSGTYGCAKCVCLTDEVQCDVSECQEFLKTEFEPTVLSNKIEVNSGNEFVDSSLNLDLDDAVRDFTLFTENLYKKSAAEAHNLTDYTDIKDQMVGYLADKDFEAKKQTNSTTVPCESFTFSYDRFHNLSSYLTKTDYVVNGLYEQRYAGTKEKLNKIVIHSSDSQVINNSPVRQEASTIAYAVGVIKSVSTAITKTHEFSATAGISISFFKTSATYKFDKSNTVETKTSEKFNVQAPSQKVTLDPFTKMNVTYHFYQYDDIYDYFLDFEIDGKSMMTRPDFRYMYYGDPNCCSPCLLFKTANVITSPLNTFLKENIAALQSIAYKNATVVKVEEKNGKFILRNIPAMETVRNFGVDIIYGTAEKIDSGMK